MISFGNGGSSMTERRRAKRLVFFKRRRGRRRRCTPGAAIKRLVMGVPTGKADEPIPNEAQRSQLGSAPSTSRSMLVRGPSTPQSRRIRSRTGWKSFAGR